MFPFIFVSLALAYFVICRYSPSLGRSLKASSSCRDCFYIALVLMEWVEREGEEN